MPSALILSLFHTDTSESVDDELRPLNSITTVITALIFGVGAFSCVLLLAAICFCVIMLRKKSLKKESQVSRHMAAVSKQDEQHPHYEEIPMQNYPIYHTIKDKRFSIIAASVCYIVQERVICNCILHPLVTFSDVVTLI